MPGEVWPRDVHVKAADLSSQTMENLRAEITVLRNRTAPLAEVDSETPETENLGVVWEVIRLLADAIEAKPEPALPETASSIQSQRHQYRERCLRNMMPRSRDRTRKPLRATVLACWTFATLCLFSSGGFGGPVRV